MASSGFFTVINVHVFVQFAFYAFYVSFEAVKVFLLLFLMKPEEKSE